MAFAIRTEIVRCVWEKSYPLTQEIVGRTIFRSPNASIINCNLLAERVEDVGAEGWVVSSESCGFLSIGARYVREVSATCMKTLANPLKKKIVFSAGWSR